VILHPQKVDREAKQVWDTALAQDLRDHQEAWLAITPYPLGFEPDFEAGYGPVVIRNNPAVSECIVVLYISKIFRQIKAVG
jgi:hypothetical protein